MWGHARPTEFTYWLEEYLVRDILESLHEKNKPTYGNFDWDGTYEYLKTIYEGIAD